MKSFDEWFEKQDIDNWTNKKFMLKAFEAGQQSRQAEIDELRFQRDVLSNKVDELQKMIDDCIKAMDESICDIDCGTIYGILTGEQS